MRSSGNMSLISVADFFVVVLLLARQVYWDRKNIPVLTKTCDKRGQHRMQDVFLWKMGPTNTGYVVVVGRIAERW